LDNTFLISKLSEFLGVIAVVWIADISKRLVFRPVKFKYPTREGRVSAILYIIIAAIAILFYSGLFPNPFTNLKWAAPELVNHLILAAVCVVPFFGALLYRRQPLLSTGWGRKLNFNNGLRLSLLLVLLTIILRGKVNSLVDGVTAEEGLTLLVLIGTSLAEESIFRGYIQLRLSSWLGDRKGWLLTSTLFVIWHLPRLIQNPTVLWVNLGLLVVQSVLLGWIMQKGGHVVAPALYRAISDWLNTLS
jgi:membrane protease YdiL (CAAX protease family)